MTTTVEAQGQQVDVSQPMNMVLWTIQIGVAGMFFMAGGSKLSGSEQMVQLFQAIGLGQWFRYVTGFMEVGGAVLLLSNRTPGGERYRAVSGGEVSGKREGAGVLQIAAVQAAVK
jgi:hypothetical protein